MEPLDKLKADPKLDIETVAGCLVDIPFEIEGCLRDDKLWWSKARKARLFCLTIAKILEGMLNLTEEEQLQMGERINRRMNEVMNQTIIESRNAQRAKLERIRQARAACKTTLEGAGHFVWDARHHLKENCAKLYEAARRWHLAAQPLVIASKPKYHSDEWDDYDEKDPLYRV